MGARSVLLSLCFLAFTVVRGQDEFYNQYMQQAEIQPVAAPRGGGFGMAVASVVGFAAGHFSPFGGKSSKKSQKELERLYQIISAKNVEVQKLKTMIYEYEYRNQELKQALYESEQESLKRDYEEFKQPDANGDDVISRAEFATYISNYMKAYPHIPKEEYPTFEDFDMNRDGLVTFQEWQEYLYQQQLAEQQQTQQSGSKHRQQNAAVNNMYDQSSGAQNFNSLYEQLQQQVRSNYR